MRAVLLTVVALAACNVDLPDVSGLACDDQHPCSEGRDCIGGFCQAEGSVGGGGTAGGTAGGGVAGGGTAGGGMTMTPDAGHVLWQQDVDGFTGQQVFNLATLQVKADAGNQVTSTVPSSLDANDRATANYNDAGHLPATGHGRLKGKFRLPATLSLKANSTFVRLESMGSSLMSITFDSSGRLVVSSASGFIGPSTITQTVSWPNGFSANTDYTIDVAWRRGQYRSLFVNGVDAGTLGTTDPAGMPLPDQLRLGIYRYDGDAGTGWSVILNDWALADGPTVPL